MSELDIRSRVKKYKLKEIGEYIPIVEKIRDFGLNVKEPVIEHLPDEISHIPDRVREIFQEVSKKRDITFAEIVNMYKNIPRIETLTRYIIFYACAMCCVKDLRTEKLLECIREMYSENLREFLENPEYRQVDSIVNALSSKYHSVDKDKAVQHILKFTHGVRKVVRAYKKDVFEWIMTKKTLREMEQDFRLFFPKKMNERARRALKMLIRLFSHVTNVPLAIFAIRNEEYRKYVVSADMYSTLVTLRSGAFLIMKLDSEKARQLETQLKTSQGPVIVRADAVKGLVRAVAKLSLDPVLYERGAFYIGYRYCSKMDCDNCPIKDVCKKFVQIVLK